MTKISLLLLFALISSPTFAQFTQQFNLSDLNGINGFVINGTVPFDQVGKVVDGAGDINGDGIDDVIVGTDLADKNNTQSAGKAWVVFGSADNFAPSIDLTTLNGNNGFVMAGINEAEYFAHSVSRAGDINDDGIDDLVVGNRQKSFTSAPRFGNSYVVFGSDQAFTTELSLSGLNGSNGFKINSEVENFTAGFLVSEAGDVNGDGISDLLISELAEDDFGLTISSKRYIVFGSNQGFSATLDLATLDGTNGFALTDDIPDDQSVFSIAAAGDVNGDGVDDVIIGANETMTSVVGAGKTYVIYGNDTTPFNAKFNLSDIDGSNGFVLNGINADDFSGSSVSKAGDFNGDGVGDFVLSAPGADPDQVDRAGQSYLVYGDASGFPANVDLSTIDGSNGFVINGVNTFDLTGDAVTFAGDINADGLDDVIVGAKRADATGNFIAGRCYVIYGTKNLFTTPFNVSDIDGVNGFVINGVAATDEACGAVSYAGDVNADGVDDIIIGAALAGETFNSDEGRSYVVFGNDAIFINGLE